MIDKKLKSDVEKIIQYSQDLDVTLDATELLNKWAVSKEKYIKLFGGKNIYEVGDVTACLSDDQKWDNLSKFRDDIYRTLSYPEDVNTCNFIKNLGLSVYTNILPTDYTLPDGKNIPAGMKISKALKFFIEDKELLDRIQTQLSRLIQEDKITGTLCLSVDPRDYLSVSENACNWRSCHALDGEYRAGNLAYMIDTSTIVCYLKEKEDTWITRFPHDIPWNSKKWRMLLFNADDDNAIFAGRHYPFFSYDLMEYVRLLWKKLLEGRRMFPISGIALNGLAGSPDYLHMMGWSNSSVDYSHWHDDKIKEVEFKEHEEDNFNFVNTYIPINGNIKSLENIISHSNNDLHYNDLLKSSCYSPYYAWRIYPREKHIYFSIGDKEVPCPCCGKRKVELPDTLLCSDCAREYSNIVECADCGEWINKNNAVYVEGTGYVCQGCFDDHWVECGNCGRLMNTNYDDNAIYSDEYGGWLCRDCYDEGGYED